MSGTREDRDEFEDGLGDALRRTGAGFSPEGRDLADGGVRRGRRRQRRRRVAAVTGGVTAVAVVAFGASYATGIHGGGGGADGAQVAARPEAPQSVPGKQGGGKGPGPHLSDRQVVGILEGLLPEGTVSGREGRGTDTELHPYARLVYDDGRGEAAISASVAAVDPDGRMAEQQLDCPDKAFTPHDSCTSETLPDGTRLQLLRGYVYPDKRVETKWWHAYLVTPDGYAVDVSQYNAPAEKDAPVSRAEPPLSLDQLKDLAGSEKWRPVMQAVGGAEEEQGEVPPAGQPDAAAILKNLKSLLPERAKVVRGDGENDFAFVVVDDGKGESLVQINVQADMDDVAGQLFGPDAEVLPDGTKLTTQQGPAEKGGTGAVAWTVDTIREDGFRVVVSVLNAGAHRSPATRTAPALSMEELRELALSPSWRER